MGNANLGGPAGFTYWGCNDLRKYLLNYLTPADLSRLCRSSLSLHGLLKSELFTFFSLDLLAFHERPIITQRSICLALLREREHVRSIHLKSPLPRGLGNADDGDHADAVFLGMLAVYLPSFIRLQCFIVVGDVFLSPHLLTNLAGLSGIVHLQLFGSNLETLSLDKLASLSDLRILDGVASSNLATLRPSIRTLVIDFKQITDMPHYWLENLPNLRDLTLKRVRFVDGDHHLPHLKSLDLSHCRRLGTWSCPRLRDVSLEYNITSETSAVLQWVKNIQSLRVVLKGEYQFPSAIVNAVKSLGPGLRQLYLDGFASTPQRENFTGLQVRDWYDLADSCQQLRSLAFRVSRGGRRPPDDHMQLMDTVYPHMPFLDHLELIGGVEEIQALKFLNCYHKDFLFQTRDLLQLPSKPTLRTIKLSTGVTYEVQYNTAFVQTKGPSLGRINLNPQRRR